MKKLKIGIIGVGRLGYEHACNIANRVPGSELVAIADANFDRAKQVAEELGVTAVYNDPKALCEDPEGCVDFPTVFKLLDEYNYEGWLVVEAEQDPAKANPLDYARMARAYVKEHTGL